MSNLLFITFRFVDIIDIFLVAILLYQIYKLVKGTVAISIFIGILSVYMLWYLVRALGMELLSTILGQFIGVGVIALLIVFQQELRRFLLLIGTKGFFNRISFFNKFISSKLQKDTDKNSVTSIVTSCKNMSISKTGALIVVVQRSDLNMYVNDGVALSAKISSELIESIFFKNNPLHDGAIIIKNNTILSAANILPVSENPNLPSHFGLRHRAAIGITQKTDAISIIVSEETGAISYIKNGQIKHNVLWIELQKFLQNIFLKK